MKRILTAIAALAISAQAMAQIDVDLQGGLASPMGSAFEYSKNIGATYSLAIMYAPGILDGLISFGLAKEGSYMLAASAGASTMGIDLKASRLGFLGVKSRYDFRKENPKPFAAITMGCGSLKCHYIYENALGGQPGSVAPLTGCLEQNKFCAKPEIGVAFGCFTISAGWVVPVSFSDSATGRKMKAGAAQYMIGFRIPVDIY